MLGYTFKQMILFLLLFAFIATIIWFSYWCENEYEFALCKLFPKKMEYLKELLQILLSNVTKVPVAPESKIAYGLGVAKVDKGGTTVGVELK